MTLEELQDDDGYCNIVVSDDETVGGYQSTSGQSLQRQALDSPPPKCSRRVDRSILNIAAALEPENYHEMSLPSAHFRTFTACLGPAKKRGVEKFQWTEKPPAHHGRQRQCDIIKGVPG